MIENKFLTEEEIFEENINKITKEFEKNYKEQYHQFKKAIKEYEKLHKIDSKEPLI